MKRINCVCSIILALVCFFSLSSCKKVPTQDDFALHIVDPPTTIVVGETVTFVAELQNLTSETYTLKHGIPLIALYVYPAEDDVDDLNDVIYSTLVQTVITPSEIINKSINIQFQESGDYVLRCFCSFTISDVNYYFNVENVDLTVIVE